jgi:hypothetical protein
MTRAARKSVFLAVMQVTFFLAVGSPIVAQEPDLSGLANGLWNELEGAR